MLQVFQKELGKRASCIKMLKRSVRDLTGGSSSVDSQWLQKQMEELSTRWDLVCTLSVCKQGRLEAALRQVGDEGARGLCGGQPLAQGPARWKGWNLQPVCPIGSSAGSVGGWVPRRWVAALWGAPLGARVVLCCVPGLWVV